MTVEDFKAVLAKKCEAAGSQRAYAKMIRVSPMYICDILKGRRVPGNKILAAMGFKRSVEITRTVRITKG